ncbi:MAG: SusC/RagA family TonB-linked outer membrane protein [bacterium]
MKRLKVLLWTLLFSVLSLSLVFGQALQISGRVTESLTGDGLPGANIAVKGTTLGTATDGNGNFTLSLPNLPQATLVVSFIGYITEEIEVTGSVDNLEVAMEEDVLKVSEVVVTGLATTVKKRNLANSVGTVSAKELVPAPAQTLERALNGKMAGITISQNTGAPGGGLNVNLRGISTIFGRTQPLYVVDGLIVSNQAVQSGIDIVTEATGAGSPRPQGQPTNRIADLNPNDIESIEVLKGASAAAIYGSKASNGVVIITTKGGTPGKTKVDVTQQIGFTSILNKVGVRKFTAETALAQYGQQGLDIFNANNGRFIDQEEVLYGENGMLAETTVGIRGGNERTQFFVSGLFQDEDGIVDRTGYQKYSARLNVNHRLSDRVKISVFSQVARTESDRSITGNDNTNTTLGFSLGFTPSFLNLEPDENGVYPVHPFNPSNPVQTRDLLTNNEKVFRTILSARTNWSIVKTQSQLLDLSVVGGVDFFQLRSFVFSPNELQFEINSDLPGEAVNGQTESTFSNLGINLTHSYTTEGNIMFRTTGGVQFENRNVNNLLTNSNGLVATQSNADQATQIDVFQDRTKGRERGFFLQEELDLNERIFLTAAVRGDASSSNGDHDKYYLFPKFSSSLRLSQYGLWDGLRGFFPEFKFRAAYGETGNLPQAGAKFTNLVPENIGGISGLRPAAKRGDPDLKPERTKEFEVGFDATILNGNGVLELSYYRQNIEDLILEADQPGSSGFTTLETNAGEMRTTGWEISLGLTPIRGRNLNWTTRFNFFTTESEITELNVDPFNLGGFATFLGTMRIEKGLAPTTIVGSESFDENGKVIKPLGDQNPDFNLSWNNNINFGNFELSFLWDWQQGSEIVNLGKLINDIGGTSPDFDEQVTFTLPDGSTVTDKAGIARLTVLGTITAPYIEDGSYIKLRELALSYAVPNSVVSDLFGGQLSYLRLGIAGRNLIMIADYDGYDPEVSQFGNVAIGRNIDTTPFPSSRQFYFNVAFGF